MRETSAIGMVTWEAVAEVTSNCVPSALVVSRPAAKLPPKRSTRNAYRLEIERTDGHSMATLPLCLELSCRMPNWT